MQKEDHSHCSHPAMTTWQAGQSHATVSRGIKTEKPMYLSPSQEYPLASFAESRALRGSKTGGESRGIKTGKPMYLSPLQEQLTSQFCVKPSVAR